MNICDFVRKGCLLTPTGIDPRATDNNTQCYLNFRASTFTVTAGV